MDKEDCGSIAVNPQLTLSVGLVTNVNMQQDSTVRLSNDQTPRLKWQLRIVRILLIFYHLLKLTSQHVNMHAQVVKFF